MALGFIPYKVHILSKTLRLKIWHKDGVTEKKKIKIRKYLGDEKYRITEEDRAFLQQENGRIFIYSPYKEKLLPKTYNLEKVKVRFKRLKPRFLFTFMLISVYLFVFIFGKIYIKNQIVPAFAESVYPVTLTHEYSEYIDNSYEDIKNYIIIGSDIREDMNTPHADVILLVSFNQKEKKAIFCSVLRDVFLYIHDDSIMTVDDLNSALPNYEYLEKNAAKTEWFKAKLNYSLNIQNLPDGKTYTNQEYYSEGLNSLVNTLEYNFRVPITGVISISWEEFVNVIDECGGVDIEITDEMLISEKDGEHICGINTVLEHQNTLYNKNDRFEETGVQHLNGNKALSFVRLRYVYGSSNSDVERTERIRDFCISLIKQKKTDLFKLATPETVKNASKGIYSSLSEEELCEVVDMLSQLPSLENAGTLPYAYHNYVTDDNQLCIAVDGKNDERLDIQAKKVLCK